MKVKVEIPLSRKELLLIHEHILKDSIKKERRLFVKKLDEIFYGCKGIPYGHRVLFSNLYSLLNQQENKQQYKRHSELLSGYKKTINKLWAEYYNNVANDVIPRFNTLFNIPKESLYTYWSVYLLDKANEYYDRYKGCEVNTDTFKPYKCEEKRQLIRTYNKIKSVIEPLKIYDKELFIKQFMKLHREYYVVCNTEVISIIDKMPWYRV